MINKTIGYVKQVRSRLLAFLVGATFLAVPAVQAAEPHGFLPHSVKSDRAAGSERWWRSIWGLDLTRKLSDWRPKISAWEATEGFNLARPFGKAGPNLQFSSSLPDSVQRSLRDGGDRRIGAFGGDTDIYFFLQKRW